jgi:hypothetical protein
MFHLVFMDGGPPARIAGDLARDEHGHRLHVELNAYVRAKAASAGAALLLQSFAATSVLCPMCACVSPIVR